MKKWCLFLFLTAIMLIYSYPVSAATVGNPLDLDLPARSSMLREQAVNQTLDEYEQTIKIKAALDLEFLFDRDLKTTTEVDRAELKGTWYMVKLGVDIFNRVEPYVKFGLSDLEAKWQQSEAFNIEVDADMGFAWGVGLKGIIYEIEGLGLRLTGDAQYRATKPDVSDISNGGAGGNVTDLGADFEVEEWQVALVLSKKFELPLQWQSLYLVPYTGFTVSDSNVDVSFKDSNAPGTDFSLFDANSDGRYGFLFGCDIMPSLASTFIYNFELRLVDEIAFSMGGAVKF